MQFVVRFGVLIPTPSINIHEDNFTKAVIKRRRSRLEIELCCCPERKFSPPHPPPSPKADLNLRQTRPERWLLSYFNRVIH